MSRTILKSSSRIGILALMSRCIAFLREYFLIRFLSIGDVSDIFFTAFRIPNTMRKIFAEGLLSSILIPAIVQAHHAGGHERSNRLTTLAFLLIETFIFLFCCVGFVYAPQFIYTIAPGFTYEKIVQTAHLLKILIFFIFFISSGAIFAAALQAYRHFVIPALAPALLNILYVAALGICWMQSTSLDTFCWFMIIISAVYFLLHVAAYMWAGLRLSWPTVETWQDFSLVLMQFLPCFVSSGILEINHFINTALGSYLVGGSLTLIRTSFQFVNIPVGIIAASLSTVLLPHFSKMHAHKSEDVQQHIAEALKFIIWSTAPICFLLYFFSKEIFETLFFGDSAALHKIDLAQSVFKAYLLGLLAFCVNKIFLTIFYALRLSFVPMLGTLGAILVNYSMSRLLLPLHGAAGIACAASLSSIFQSLFFVWFMSRHLHLKWEKCTISLFFSRFCLQLISGIFVFMISFEVIRYLLCFIQFSYHLSVCNFAVHITEQFFITSIGIWLWVGPLALIWLYGLYLTRKKFGIYLDYFDR